MTKKVVLLSASWLMVAFTMLMIFNFSEEDSNTSASTSQGVIEEVLGAVMDKDDITPELVNKFQLPVRKIAHFGIYMLLGFCLSNAFRETLHKKKWLGYVCSLPTAIIYAACDEFHQKFSYGRSPAIKDVLIDSSGALFGILIYLGIYYFFLKTIKNSQS